MNTQPSYEALAKRLVEETGISPEAARELIRILGTNWSSLVREAKIRKGHKGS